MHEEIQKKKSEKESATTLIREGFYKGLGFFLGSIPFWLFLFILYILTITVLLGVGDDSWDVLDEF